MHLVVNPAAAGGRLGRQWPSIRERLRALGVELAETLTARPGDATEIASELVEGGEDAVVAVGGDGTVDEVVQGLHRSGGGALGILPLGTGNDAASMLGIPKRLEGAAQVLREGSRRRVDLIGAGDRVVLNAVGIGLLGAINVNSSNIKWVRGMSAYLVAGVATLANYRCPRIELTGDGVDYAGPMTILAIQNGATTGGGFPLCPRARPDDGALDATLVRETGVVARLGAITHAIRGTLARKPYTRELAAPRLELRCDQPLPCHWDGNPAHIAPPGITFAVLPRALEVVAPPAADG